MRLVLTLVCAASLFGQRQPFNVQTMLKLSRISEPVLSPDGKLVAFTVQTIDLDKNTKPKQIYVVSPNGGLPHQITREGTDNERPRWSPDSKQLYLYFESRRLVADLGDECRRDERAPDHPSFDRSRRDRGFAGRKEDRFHQSNVYPDCGADDACNKAQIEAEKKSKVKARIYTSLLYRHWNEWQGKRRQHMLVDELGRNGDRWI